MLRLVQTPTGRIWAAVVSSFSDPKGKDCTGGDTPRGGYLSILLRDPATVRCWFVGIVLRFLVIGKVGG